MKNLHKDENGTALVMAIAFLTIILGFAVSMDMAVKRSQLSVQMMSDRSVMRAVFNNVTLYSLEKLRAGDWIPAEGATWSDTAVFETAGVQIDPITVTSGGPGSWILNMRAHMKKGQQEITLNRIVRIYGSGLNYRVQRYWDV